MASSGAATAPPVALEYRSAFADYRRFDAQAPMVAWRQANDAIGRGSEGAAHRSHGMHGTMEPAPADTTGSEPTTIGDDWDHRR